MNSIIAYVNEPTSCLNDCINLCATWNENNITKATKIRQPISDFLASLLAIVTAMTSQPSVIFLLVKQARYKTVAPKFHLALH